MLSGAKPAAVMFSRNGVCRLFQVGTERPCLSLPRHVSTMILCVGVSTDQRMDRHFQPAFRSCKFRHQPRQRMDLIGADLRENEACAANRLAFDDLRDPDLADRPLHQAFTPLFFLGWKDAGFRRGAQWIISRGCALSEWNTGPCSEERAMPELAISSEKVGFLIEKARQFDAKDIASDPDSGSNGADDDMIDVLEDNGEDPVARRSRASSARSPRTSRSISSP